MISPDARADIDEHVLWSRSQAGAETAYRFALAVDRCLLGYAATPDICSPVASRRPELRNLRKGRVPGFRDILELNSTQSNRRGFTRG